MLTTHFGLKIVSIRIGFLACKEVKWNNFHLIESSTFLGQLWYIRHRFEWNVRHWTACACACECNVFFFLRHVYNEALTQNVFRDNLTPQIYRIYSTCILSITNHLSLRFVYWIFYSFKWNGNGNKNNGNSFEIINCLGFWRCVMIIDNERFLRLARHDKANH